VLLTVAVPMLQVAVQRQQENDLRFALMQIREGLDAYKKASEQGRIALKVGESGFPASLEQLVEGVDDQRSPTRQKLYFLRRLPRDPFHRDLETAAAQTWGIRSYASPPTSPSEGPDVFDVYSKSGRIGLNGVAYRDW
jgi:general secretion pathway protein G